MATSFISTLAANGTSMTLPTHASGDLILMYAYRDEGALGVPIIVPRGWAVVSFTRLVSSAAVVAFKWAKSAAEASGTWTNAEGIVASVYRGVHTDHPIGNCVFSEISNTNVVYPALPLVVIDGTSWVVAFGGVADTHTEIDTPPTGMTFRDSAVANTTHTVVCHDTNGGVSSWTQQTVAMPSVERQVVAMVEIIDAAGSPPVYYVDSAAGGANDGSSKTDAWTSLASAVNVGPGAIIHMEDSHNQNPGASASWTFANGTPSWPVQIFSVDFSDDSYSPAVSANLSGALSDLTLTGFVELHGLYLDIADDLEIGTGSGAISGRAIVDCVIGSADTMNLYNRTGNASHEGVNFVIGAGTDFRIWAEDGAHVLFRDCIWTGTAGTSFVLQISDGGQIWFDDCDLSLWASLLATITACRVVLRRCKLHASALATMGTTVSYTNSSLRIENCQDGTITVPPMGLTKYVTYWGTILGDAVRYRTGGSNDGIRANPYSWAITSNANARESITGVEGPTLLAFADPDASISGATARGIRTSSISAPLATPAALTTDGTSTWNGASGSELDVKQKIEIALTNGQTLTVYFASAATLNDDDVHIVLSEPDQVGGPIKVVPWLMKPSTTVYFDPRLEVA